MSTGTSSLLETSTAMAGLSTTLNYNMPFIIYQVCPFNHTTTQRPQPSSKTRTLFEIVAQVYYILSYTWYQVKVCVCSSH